MVNKPRYFSGGAQCPLWSCVSVKGSTIQMNTKRRQSCRWRVEMLLAASEGTQQTLLH